MNSRDRITPGDRSRCEAVVGAVEHVTCGLIGLLVAAVLVSAVYPWLVAATSALQLLSSTALVFIAVGLWFLSWGALEMAWEWRAGRLSGFG
jgi:hypothetical protein